MSLVQLGENYIITSMHIVCKVLREGSRPLGSVSWLLTGDVGQLQVLYDSACFLLAHTDGESLIPLRNILQKMLLFLQNN